MNFEALEFYDVFGRVSMFGDLDQDEVDPATAAGTRTHKPLFPMLSGFRLNQGSIMLGLPTVAIMTTALSREF